MKKYEYEMSIAANSQQEADEKMKAIIAIVSKLKTDELKKIAEVVSNPVKLSVVKLKLNSL